MFQKCVVHKDLQQRIRTPLKRTNLLVDRLVSLSNPLKITATCHGPTRFLNTFHRIPFSKIQSKIAFIVGKLSRHTSRYNKHQAGTPSSLFAAVIVCCVPPSNNNHHGAIIVVLMMTAST